MYYQILAAAPLLVIYGIYVLKLLHQKKRGIQTYQLMRGTKSKRVFYTELMMMLASVCTVVMEIVSIVDGSTYFSDCTRNFGVVLGLSGALLFAMGVWAMRDSWRAGIPADDQTELITGGIYRYSRNPAFVGISLTHIAIVLIFFNWPLLICVIWALVMIHLLIIQEEIFLQTRFAASYADYKSKVGRYFGRTA